MKPYYQEDGITIICGDVRRELPHLAPASVGAMIELNDSYCELAIKRLAQGVLGY